MGRKLCPKIILEGTRLTLKTDIAFALNEHPRIVGPRRYRYHSPIISGEWGAFTNDPWGHGLINFEADEEAHAMATYSTWAQLFEQLPYYSWIVDRFHISTQLHQRLYRGVDYDFGWLEARLRPIGFRVVLCTRTADGFEAARQKRLKVSGNPSQYDDLDRFVAEQDVVRELVERSRLPSLEVDVSDNDVAATCDRIADWLEEAGGLYADY